jgi:hypothetical protein
MANFLKNALGRPQRGHLLYALTENFGFFLDLAINEFLAIPNFFS